MPKVSVIIPVYGVEKYMERCARSLFEQTLDDIEYLFIDDCTPDNSIRILKDVLEDYPQRKSQVVIHRMETNSGQAKVREWGIKHASGDYIIHCDSDDWVDTYMCELMYSAAVTGNYDIVLCDYKRTDGQNETLISDPVEGDCKDYFRSVLSKKSFSSICNKLVRQDLYRSDLVFPNDNNAEDYALLSQLVYLSHSVFHIDKPLYFYYNNRFSITEIKDKEWVTNRFRQFVRNIGVVERFLELNGEKGVYEYELDCAKLDAKRLLLPYISDRSVYLEWKSTFPDVAGRMKNNPLLTERDKWRYNIVNLRMYPFVRKIMNLMN